MSYESNNLDIWQAKYLKYKAKYNELKDQYAAGWFGSSSLPKDHELLKKKGEIEKELKELAKKKKLLKSVIDKYSSSKKEFDNVASKLEGKGFFSSFKPEDIQLQLTAKTDEFNSSRNKIHESIVSEKKNVDEIIELINNEIKQINKQIGDNNTKLNDNKIDIKKEEVKQKEEKKANKGKKADAQPAAQADAQPAAHADAQPAA